MAFVVDVLYFKQKDDGLIIKEMAIVSTDSDENPKVYLFKPPFSWYKLSKECRRKNLFLELYHHGLDWKSGTLEFNSIISVLQSHLSDATIIYVNNNELKEWMENFNCKMINLTEMGYENDIFSTSNCNHHNRAYRTSCALHNVTTMKQFVSKHRERKRRIIDELFSEDIVG